MQGPHRPSVQSREAKVHATMADTSIASTGIASAAPTAPAASSSKYDRLIAEAKRVAAAKAIVVHPCDETSLRGAIEATKIGLISPTLVGPRPATC